MYAIIAKLFGFLPKETPKPTQEAHNGSLRTVDPLDVIARQQGWIAAPPNPIQRTISEFHIAEKVDGSKFAMDGAIIKADAMDDVGDEPISPKYNSMVGVPDQLQQWFMSQSFIGYQACAIIAQHWLVDKACSMAGEDAIRNGWELKVKGDDKEMSKSEIDELRAYDVEFQLKANLSELERFKNIFGIRVAIFQVDSDDPDYYEKPFNIDGVTKGSYKGISQVDPYWMMPVLTAASTANPAGIHFYDPEYWVIGGKKYHRTHLIIARGPQPADVLKPTYIFGGIPMTQRIYERVYAAERTANEAPLLSLSKRTTALHVDVEKALINQDTFEKKLMFWIKYRDNHAVKVLGKDETMEQFDTNLADFDSVIMNQYQLVAAIAEVPATKLLGTSPKGFNATGDFETVSYHEHLESIQEHTMHPLAERHYAILGRSLGINCDVEVVFDPVDSVTAAQLAELNNKKAATDTANVNIGAISPEEVRQRLRDDKHSGYNRLSDEEAEDEPGMSPENLAQLQTAGAAEERGGATEAGAGIKPGSGTTNPMPLAENPADAESNTPKPRPHDPVTELLGRLSERLSILEEALVPDGNDISHDNSVMARTTKPSIKNSTSGSVSGIGQVVANRDPLKHPKMKVGGLLLSIENPRGTVRQGIDINGSSWSTKMPHHYGFIKGVMGADGDELDCFVGPNLQSDKVFVINQNDPLSGQFDEHKVMLGFDSLEAAEAAYNNSYHQDWEGFGDIQEISMDQFKGWIGEDCTKPFVGE